MHRRWYALGWAFLGALFGVLAVTLTWVFAVGAVGCFAVGYVVERDLPRRAMARVGRHPQLLVPAPFPDRTGAQWVRVATRTIESGEAVSASLRNKIPRDGSAIRLSKAAHQWVDETDAFLDLWAPTEKADRARAEAEFLRRWQGPEPRWRSQLIGSVEFRLRELRQKRDRASPLAES